MATLPFINYNPATGEEIHTPLFSINADVDQAIARAKKALPGWAATSPLNRSRILLKAASLLYEQNDAIARLETQDTGKPFSETSTVDIITGAEVLEYYANLVAGGGLNGETIRLRDDAYIYSTKEPLGVCAGIGAWNYPIQIALWKSAPALAAGNVLIYKPSEFTPLHASLLSSIFLAAGLPPDVFTPVYGAGPTGAYLTSHPSIAKVSFTGQVSTGKLVASTASSHLKYTTMELGGKSPLLILPDADLDAAADGAMMANFFSTGQVCTNGTRVFIDRPRKADFEKRLLAKMPFVRIGHPLDPKTNFGPLVSEVHLRKVRGYIHYGIEIDKAKLIYGGLDTPAEVPAKFKKGYWVRPTIFTDCTDNMRIVREEIFGPVMTILTYDTVDEAVRRANDTRFGLAAGVFTKDVAMGQRVVAGLEAGITWINTWGESPPEMSVGGWKESGLGVENGKRGLEGWTRNKSTLVETGPGSTVFGPEVGSD